MPKDAAEKLNRLDEFNQAQITGKAERVKKNQQRGQSLQLVESQRERVWPGTESSCRHEDFQSSYRTGTMCHYRSLLVSIQGFNGGLSPVLVGVASILPIRTHSSRIVLAKLWQSKECRQPSFCCRSNRPTEYHGPVRVA